MTSILFELCRISSELQMTHLESLSIQHYCELTHQYFLGIDPSTTETDDEEEEIHSSRSRYLQSVLRVCEKYLLERLHVSVMFLLESGAPLHLLEDKVISRGGGGKAGVGKIVSSGGAGGLGAVDFDSPTALRRAISESVHDVTSLLVSDEEGGGRGARGGGHPSYSYPDPDSEEMDPTIPYSSSRVPARSGSASASGSRKPSSSSSSSKPSSKSLPGKKTTGGSQSTKKGTKTSGGGIYKLLLQESSSTHPSSHGGFAIGTEVDTSILDTSSQDDLPEYYDPDIANAHDHFYGPDSSGGGPILVNATSRSSSGGGTGQSSSSGARKGKTLNVEEFIQTQHSLAPPLDKKLTPAQKRSCIKSTSPHHISSALHLRLEEISKPKQTKTPLKTRGRSVKKVASSTDELVTDPTEGNGELTEDLDTGPGGSRGGMKIEEYDGEKDSLAEKKPISASSASSRSQLVGKKPPAVAKTGTSKTKTKPPPLVDPNILDPSLSPESSLTLPSFSHSPVIRDDEQRHVPSSSSTTVEVNESVRASLQLLKKKPRGRGVAISRASSMTESVDTLNEVTPPQTSVASSFPDPPPPESEKPMSVAPMPTQPPPQKKPLAPTRKASSLPSAAACSRTSDCSCALCQIPVEELPIVEVKTSALRVENHEREEDMIGSSKLTTLMKTRQEMNKQKEGKKKEVKSAK
jgi:hypothetical protein